MGHLNRLATLAEAKWQRAQARMRQAYEASWDYDPHYCMHRELEGQAILAEWLAQ